MGFEHSGSNISKGLDQLLLSLRNECYRWGRREPLNFYYMFSNHWVQRLWDELSGAHYDDQTFQKQVLVWLKAYKQCLSMLPDLFVFRSDVLPNKLFFYILLNHYDDSLASTKAKFSYCFSDKLMPRVSKLIKAGMKPSDVILNGQGDPILMENVIKFYATIPQTQADFDSEEPLPYPLDHIAIHRISGLDNLIRSWRAYRDNVPPRNALYYFIKMFHISITQSNPGSGRDSSLDYIEPLSRLIYVLDVLNKPYAAEADHSYRALFERLELDPSIWDLIDRLINYHASQEPPLMCEASGELDGLIKLEVNKKKLLAICVDIAPDQKIDIFGGLALDQEALTALEEAYSSEVSSFKTAIARANDSFISNWTDRTEACHQDPLPEQDLPTLHHIFWTQVAQLDENKADAFYALTDNFCRFCFPLVENVYHFMNTFLSSPGFDTAPEKQKQALESAFSASGVVQDAKVIGLIPQSRDDSYGCYELISHISQKPASEMLIETCRLFDQTHQTSQFPAANFSAFFKDSGRLPEKAISQMRAEYPQYYSYVFASALKLLVDEDEAIRERAKNFLLLDQSGKIPRGRGRFMPCFTNVINPEVTVPDIIFNFILNHPDADQLMKLLCTFPQFSQRVVKLSIFTPEAQVALFEHHLNIVQIFIFHVPYPHYYRISDITPSVPVACENLKELISSLITTNKLSSLFTCPEKLAALTTLKGYFDKVEDRLPYQSPLCLENDLREELFSVYRQMIKKLNESEDPALLLSFLEYFNQSIAKLLKHYDENIRVHKYYNLYELFTMPLLNKQDVIGAFFSYFGTNFLNTHHPKSTIWSYFSSLIEEEKVLTGEISQPHKVAVFELVQKFITYCGPEKPPLDNAKYFIRFLSFFSFDQRDLICHELDFKTFETTQEYQGHWHYREPVIYDAEFLELLLMHHPDIPVTTRQTVRSIIEQDRRATFSELVEIGAVTDNKIILWIFGQKPEQLPRFNNAAVISDMLLAPGELEHFYHLVSQHDEKLILSLGVTLKGMIKPNIHETSDEEKLLSYLCAYALLHHVGTSSTSLRLPNTWLTSRVAPLHDDLSSAFQDFHESIVSFKELLDSKISATVLDKARAQCPETRSRLDQVITGKVFELLQTTPDNSSTESHLICAVATTCTEDDPEAGIKLFLSIVYFPLASFYRQLIDMVAEIDSVTLSENLKPIKSNFLGVLEVNLAQTMCFIEQKIVFIKTAFAQFREDNEQNWHPDKQNMRVCFVNPYFHLSNLGVINGKGSQHGPLLFLCPLGHGENQKQLFQQSSDAWKSAHTDNLTLLSDSRLSYIAVKHEVYLYKDASRFGLCVISDHSDLCSASRESFDQHGIPMAWLDLSDLSFHTPKKGFSSLYRQKTVHHAEENIACKTPCDAYFQVVSLLQLHDDSTRKSHGYEPENLLSCLLKKLFMTAHPTPQTIKMAQQLVAAFNDFAKCSPYHAKFASNKLSALGLPTFLLENAKDPNSDDSKAITIPNPQNSFVLVHKHSNDKGSDSASVCSDTSLPGAPS